MTKSEDNNKPPAALTPEAYVEMNDKEKDAEIARSIIRLQSRVQKILYHSEIEWARKISRQKSDTDKKND